MKEISKLYMKIKMNKLYKQIIKFGITGIMNTLVDFGLFNLLILLTGIHSSWRLGLLNTIAVSAAMLNSYLMNSKWTFNRKDHTNNSTARFIMISIVGMLINSLIVTVVSSLSGYLPFSIYVIINAGKIVGALFSSTWNFIGYRNWVFYHAEEVVSSSVVETTAIKGMLSIVIPAYNEALRLPQRLHKLAAAMQNHDSVEIIVVDDGSTDDTRKLTEEISRDFSFIRCISYVPNQGKGNAVKTGMLNARGEYIIFVDADETFTWEHIKLILDKLQNGCQVAVGVRKKSGSGRVAGESILRYFMGRTFNLMVQMVILPGCPDSQCGIKGFTRDAAEEIFKRERLKSFAFDVEVLALARALQYDIVNVPVEAADCEGSSVNRLLAPLIMARDVIKVKLNLGLKRYDLPKQPVPWSNILTGLGLVVIVFTVATTILWTFSAEGRISIISMLSLWETGL
ncbi:MAG TPA: glycosyltransferase [Syntrophomonadaceae bacterium]|nr:glycosyltransferase [Syntrophomonadaceae bacterium]